MKVLKNPINTDRNILDYTDCKIIRSLAFNIKYIKCPTCCRREFWGKSFKARNVSFKICFRESQIKSRKIK